MPDLLLDSAFLLPVSVAVLFPILVAIGVYVLRRVITRRNPDLDSH